MGRCWESGLVFVCLPYPHFWGWVEEWGANCDIGQLDRDGNARKVVNCSCVVVKDWGEESQERSVLLNYFQTEQ